MKPFYSEALVTLYNADCIQVARALPSDSVDMLCTDPPYSSGGAFRGDRANATDKKYIQTGSRRLEDFDGDARDQRTWQIWTYMWLIEYYRVLKPGAIAALFIDWRQLSAAIDALQVAGYVYRGIVVWDKGAGSRPVMGRFKNQAEFVVWGTKGPRSLDGHTKCLPGVLMHTTLTRQKTHIAQKPLSLMIDLLKILDPGDTVIDPFAGSGTTIEAARMGGIHAIAVESKKHWCEEAAGRLKMNLATDNLARARENPSLFEAQT